MPSKKVQMLLTDAEALCTEFTKQCAVLGIVHTEIAGSIRRRSRYVGDVDLIVEGDLGLLKLIPGFEIFEGGTERVSGTFKGQQFNVFRAEKAYWGATLWYLTGPQGTTIGYRMKARNKGWLLNQYGLFDKEGKRIAGETEEGLYAAFDKPWKSPELRK